MIKLYVLMNHLQSRNSAEKKQKTQIHVWFITLFVIFTTIEWKMRRLQLLMGQVMCVVVFQTPRFLLLLLLGECSLVGRSRSEHDEQPGQMGHADPS